MPKDPMRWFKKVPPDQPDVQDATLALGRREQIARAALNLLADLPLERLTTREIAAAVGVSQPALFRHFATREEILIAVVALAKGELETEVLRLFDPGEAAMPPLVQCAELARALIRYVQQYPGVPRLLFADLALDLPRLRVAVGALVTMPRALVAERVGEAQRLGMARPGADPQAAGALFVSMLQGVFLQRALGELDPAQMPERLEALIDLWLQAVQFPGDLPVPALAVLPQPAAPALPLRPELRLLDVRPILAGGVDPLSAILAALAELPLGSRLVVSAPFRPRPLEALLASRGHEVTATGGETGAWTVTVGCGNPAPLLDFRDLEPPEPLERLIALGRKLPADEVAVAHLPRSPRWLFPQLQAIGCTAQVVELADGTALIAVGRNP